MTATSIPLPDSVPEQRPAGGRLVVPALALASLLTMVNQSALAAFMPAISRDLDISIPVLGQVTTAIFLGSAVISLFAGPLADEYGKRRLLVIGLVAMVASALGTALAPDFGWLLATRMISAVSGGVMAGTTMAIAGTLFDGDARRRAISWIAAGIASGAIVGLPALTLVAALSSWRVSYAVIGLLSLIWIPLLRLCVPDDAVDGGGRMNLKRTFSAYRPLVGSHPMLALYGACVARAIAWIGMLTYYGAFLSDEKGLTTGEIGWAYMAGGSGYFAGNKLAGGRLGARSLRLVFGASSAILGGFLVASIVLPVGAVASVALLAVSAMAGGVGWVSLLTLVSTESPGGQGATMSLNAAMFTSGSALGGLFGGGLLAVGGYTTLGLGLLGFSFVSALLVWRPGQFGLPARPRPVIPGARWTDPGG